MKLKNLSMAVHGKGYLQHRITYVNENGTQCRETLCSGVEFAQHVIDCLDAVPSLINGHNALRESHSMIATALQIDSTKPSDILKAVDTLRKERDDAASNALAFSTELNELMADELLDRLGLENGYTPEQFHASMKVLFNEHGELQGTINGLKHLLELPASAGLTELFNAVEALGLNKSQLSEIRYVLHGDIQPCSVLYSDETTTLLRLDEGDMMLETDTIEWSDSVTYRCQELLKSAAVKLSVPVTLSPIKLLAQLVRDERILLNDNGDDEFPQQEIEQPCDECSHIFDAQSMTCPVCNTIRSSECTDTVLTSLGHGYYAPVQRQAIKVKPDTSDIPFMGHSPVQER